MGGLNFPGDSKNVHNKAPLYMYKFALNLQRAETICQVHVHLYVAKFKDQSSLEFSLTGKFLLSTESITSVAFQLNSQSQFLIYSRIFRTFPIAIVFPSSRNVNRPI